MIAPCAVCGLRPPGKAASVYWRWQSTPDDWHRYRQRFCVTCFQHVLLPMYLQARRCDIEQCIADDETPHSDDYLVVTWATMYTPKSNDQINFEFAHCPAHSKKAHERLTVRADDLNDQQGSGRGRPLPDPWDSVDVPENDF